MKYTAFFGFCLLGAMWLAVTGCMADEAAMKAVPRHKIDLSDARSFSFSEWFDTLEYVPLASDGRYFLGDIRRLKVFGEYIAVIDVPGGDPSRLSIFDRTGALRAVIGLREEGPERLVHINDVWIDPPTGRIFVLDKVQQKIIEFDAEGSFKSFHYIPGECSQMVNADPPFVSWWLYFDNTPLMLPCAASIPGQKEQSERDHAAEIVSNGAVPDPEDFFNVRYVNLETCEMHGGAPIRPSLMNVNIGYDLFSNYTRDNRYFFHMWFTDTIYSFYSDQPTSFAPFASFDFGPNAFSTEDEARFASAADPYEQMVYLNRLKGKVKRFQRTGYAGGALWIRFGCKGEPFLLRMEDRFSQPILLVNSRTAQPNDFDYMTFLPVEVSFFDKGFVFRIPAHLIKDALNDSNEQLKKLPQDDIRHRRFEVVKKLLAHVGRDDNPVLVFARLKK